jgi:hypothetical protein
MTSATQQLFLIRMPGISMTDRKKLFQFALMFCGLVAVGVAGRVLPHVPNFTPIAATALFAGFFFQSRLVAVAIPLTAMLISDLFWLGSHDFRVMMVVYASLAFPVLLRHITRHEGKWQWARVLGSATVASIVFFVASNFAVWAWSGMYKSTPSGLLSCYLSALPFFKYTFAGDLVWSTGFFGAYALASALQQHGDGKLAAHVAVR